MPKLTLIDAWHYKVEFANLREIQSVIPTEGRNLCFNETLVPPKNVDISYAGEAERFLATLEMTDLKL